MIPQNPLTSLNPVLTVEDHFQEVLSLHIGLNKEQGRARTIDLLRVRGHPRPGYPYGGVPPSPERGPAPTRDDRHGHGL